MIRRQAFGPAVFCAQKRGAGIEAPREKGGEKNEGQSLS